MCMAAPQRDIPIIGSHTAMQPGWLHRLNRMSLARCIVYTQMKALNLLARVADETAGVVYMACKKDSYTTRRLRSCRCMEKQGCLEEVAGITAQLTRFTVLWQEELSLHF